MLITASAQSNYSDCPLHTMHIGLTIHTRTSFAILQAEFVYLFRGAVSQLAQAMIVQGSLVTCVAHQPQVDPLLTEPATHHQADASNMNIQSNLDKRMHVK